MKKTAQQISYNMSMIRSKKTSIERTFAGGLRERKIRYRGNVKRVIGKPDFVVLDKKIAIFCDSAFWHGHRFMRTNRHKFKTNRAFWLNKILSNIKRDRFVNRQLKSLGWQVVRFWDFQINNNIEQCLNRLENIIIKP